MDIVLKTLKNEMFIEVNPSQYAVKLRDLYRQNPKKWIDTIIPLETALDLQKETNNDFSAVWHVHCDSCFKHLDKNNDETCYCTLDEITWLCKDCFEKLRNDLNLQLRTL